MTQAKQFFCLFPETIFVPGPIGGALYLLLREKVFSLDAVRSNILKLIKNNCSLEEVSNRLGLPANEIEAFLSALEAAGAGCFVDRPYFVEKIRPLNPVEEITFFRPSPRLTILHITPTWFCSGNCKFCRPGKPISRLQPCLGCRRKDTEKMLLLTIPQIEKAIGEAACLGCRSLLLHTGSPDYCADLIFDTLLTAEKYGYNVQLASGSPIPEKFLKHLARPGTTLIFQIFSDSGPVHDEIAGKKGSFSLLMKNISFLKSKELPFKLVYLNTGKDPDPHRVLLNLETLNPGAVYGDRLVGHSSQTGDFLYGSESLLPPDISKYVTRVQGYNCLNGRLALNPDGYFSPCPSHIENKMAHISDTTVQDLFAEETLPKYWHESNKTGEICNRCEFQFACHRCQTALYSQKGSCIYGYDPEKGEWK
ncbi:MAG: hypothetical protein CVV03_01275 [Firmicutes bacterium HGW-Firmicutes-8]|nr:MAG: hypothetical protein CVV03_01275 [Firmicutes bacterium HGW-Firmicutes-8]